ncbi:hypothetical protein B0H34DRAFT_727028 [Crassisporium funariophilum]|nr:hypothetical protein B0H34DRAFT_727028 [Crassisporium funariophilum]
MSTAPPAELDGMEVIMNNVKSTSYYKYQQDDYPILDGRHPPRCQPTIAPPIELFHTVFAEFRAKLATADNDIPVSIVRRAAEFMRAATVIALCEKDRQEITRSLLSKIFQKAFSQIVNHDRTSADHILEISLANFPEAAALALVEEKFELGEGGSEPSIQGSFSYAKYWTGVGHDQILKRCSCPTFIIALAGPWLTVLGAVYTTQPVVQRLTSYLWLGNSRANDDDQVLNIARVFHALDHSLCKLLPYYTHLEPTLGPVPPTPDPRRFFPSITSYTVDRIVTDFTYIEPLEVNETTCVTFLAKRSHDNTKVVVKFTPCYGAAAHEALARLKKAPELLYCEPLSTDEFDYGKWRMVVMEYVEGKTLRARYPSGKLPKDVIDAVKAGVSALHGDDFVHGDIRDANIMIADAPDGAAEGERVKFLDFDWAGKAGEVRYPMHLGSYICTTAGVSDYDYITKEHDRKMLAKLLW